MVAPDRRSPFWAMVLLTALPGLSSGCAANRAKQATLPPVSESVARLPEREPAESVVAAPKPPTVVVIDDPAAEAAAHPPTLAEAAEAERARRATAQKPVLVLDNASLAAHGKDQKLTVAEGGGAEPEKAAADVARTTAARAEDEAYWRDRGLAIRRNWRAAYDRIDELQGEAEALRRQFYSADDPYVRDGQIKPAWDRALQDLEENRRQADQGARDVERFLDDGRRAGALPGWLREGVELEPHIDSPPPHSAEPSEPVEANEPVIDPQ